MPNTVVERHHRKQRFDLIYNRSTVTTKWGSSKYQQNKLQCMRIVTHLISSCLWSVAHAHSHSHNHNYNHSYRVRWHPLRSLAILIMSSILLVARFPLSCHAVGYSYARFIGPVSGPEREILVRDEINGGSRIDYIARPEYQFAYGVEDSETQVLQNRKETRNGDEVKGVYSVVDPDGTLRVVKYTADNLNGFQAQVITNGVATLHGQNNNIVNDDDYDDGSSKDNNAENNYEVHHDQYDENSDDHTTDNDSDSGGGNGNGNDDGDGAYYDSHDGTENEHDDVEDDDDEIEEYKEAHSEETNDADTNSNESNDY